ncbi:alpha-amylase family protein [Ideonella sp.]|uniref:alpha-amylase n=1 Tax=Ideonella sp. TaxID=1929293 RepID=UPI0035B140A2
MPQRRHALSAAVAVVLTSLPLPGTAALNPKDTSVQMFQWSWPDIARECTEWLGPQGYGAVQISPPHASKVADGWWGVYQPVNYLDLTSRMGTPAQLQQMIDTCHAAGVRVYTDVVVNQMADGSGTATDGSTWDGGSLRYPAFSGFDFHPHCVIQPADYDGPSGRQRVMDCRLGGLPDLATESGYVQGQITDYLRRLLDMGVDGLRIDAAKHMPVAPWQAILSAVRSTHPLTRQGEPLWVTQEIIPDGGVDRAAYFGLGTVNEFKFSYAMRQVFRGEDGLALADIPALMGSWGQWGGSWGFMPPQHATVFVNNWDTERNGSSLTTANHSPGAVNDTVGTKRYDLANIFMLSQGYGEAQLHSGFRFTHHDDDRPAASPYRDGQPQINVVWDFVHRWSDISPLVKFRSAMAGQPQQRWTVGDNRQQVAFNRGNAGFVALSNSGQTWQRTFATGLPAGTYCNVVQGTLTPDGSACTGATITVQADGSAALTIGPNDGSSVPAVVIYGPEGGRPGRQRLRGALHHRRGPHPVGPGGGRRG